MMMVEAEVPLCAKSHFNFFFLPSRKFTASAFGELDPCSASLKPDIQRAPKLLVIQGAFIQFSFVSSITHNSTMDIDRRKVTLFASAAAVRLLLFTSFPGLPDLLTARVEISTPVTSFKRCKPPLAYHSDYN
jgi:hypothetical protein